MIFLNFIMLFIPPLLAWYLYLHNNRYNATIKKAVIWFVICFFLVNSVSYWVSYMRGIKRISFTDMTISYRIKFFLVGCAFSVIASLLLKVVRNNLHIIKHLRIDLLCIIRDMKKYFKYAVRLAKADLRTEVANSYLDWLWWLIEPFCTMLIYVFIYGFVFKVQEEYFTAFIYIGLTVWYFFQRNVMGAVNIVRSNKSIISKIYIPKYILLFSKMLVNGFKMLISFGLVLIMMVVYKVHITVNILYVLPVMIDVYLVTFACGIVLMHYGVFMKDLSYITEIVLRMLVYLTGTFYSVAKRIPAPYGGILERVNPVAYLIAALRNALLYEESVSWELLVMWGGLALVIILFGIAMIYRNENSYVKVI